MNLRRYRAILVGATGGIGSAIARALAPHCDALLLVGRNGRGLEGLAQRDRRRGLVALAADIATACRTRRRGWTRRGGWPVSTCSSTAPERASSRGLPTRATKRSSVSSSPISLAPMQLARRLLPLLAGAVRGDDRQRGLDLRLPGLPRMRRVQREQVRIARLHRGAAPRARRRPGTRHVSRAALDAHAAQQRRDVCAQRGPRRRGRRSAGGRARAAAPARRTAPRAPAGLSRGACSRASTSSCRLSSTMPWRRQLPQIRRHARGGGDVAHVFRTIGGNHFLRSYR